VAASQSVVIIVARQYMARIVGAIIILPSFMVCAQVAVIRSGDVNGGKP